ncbi:cytochrome B561 [Endozoicomonas montiporae]|uniref:Cytochrome B561 n=2 Tax=Endozoicomonas montiporae TaxID=1027273 RepID=A0A081N0B2_9GAMM|nr:COX15/CtaA family protein [Endozoicomonas montiporae]AMO54338.1 cytochrome oxidase assembly protein [Endozoicomonas montiporae CL-33]KEQ11885.1 cytochrome B561 [Endozoicomonas montiporae]
MGTTKKKGFYLALFATVLAMVVVVLGAYTRLVHAGLGCPDWPGCYGQLTVPETAREIAVAEALFPGAPVEVEKGWAEMIHRYVAGLLLLVVLGIALLSWKHRKEPGQPLIHPVFILGLIILQAAFGMWTVTLKLWPQVVTLHLLGGFATFSLLFLLTLRLSGMGWKKLPPDVVNGLKGLGMAGLLVVIVQITLGGWISSNYAALACPDLPMCQGQWLPPADFAEGFDITQEIGPNYLGGQMDSAARTAIHLTHRLGALITVLVLLLLSFKVLTRSKQLSYSSRGSLQKISLAILFILTIQVILGLSNIIWHLPLPVAVAHNLFGALLLLSLVALNYRLRISGDE